MLNALFAGLADAPDVEQGTRITRLAEGVDDPNVLRAVFVVGAGGSGKSTIAKEMFAGRGMKHVDQDRHLERLYREMGRPLSKVGDDYGLFKHAQLLARKERDQYAGRRLGLVIDATGWDYIRIAEPVKALRRLGYDCFLVFVTTSLETSLDRNDLRAQAGGRLVPPYAIKKQWQQAQNNVLAYRRLFGAENMVVLKNDVDIDPETWSQAVAPELSRIAARFLTRPLANTVGRAWLEQNSAAVKLETDDRPTIVVPLGLFGGGW